MNMQNWNFIPLLLRQEQNVFYSWYSLWCERYVWAHAFIYNGYLPALPTCLLVTEALGPALISRCPDHQQTPSALLPHLQKNHHHLYLLSPGSSLWGKSDQTTLMHHKPLSLLQFTPQDWWHLERTERCFFFPLIWTTFCCLQKWTRPFFSELFLCPLTWLPQM